MPTPTTWPSAKQAVGWAKETVQGTQVLPLTWTNPIETFEPEDVPVWLDDKAMRNSMVDFYGRQQGVMHTEWQMAGPAFMDGLPFLVNNILGDITSTGTLPVSHAMSLLNSGSAQPGSLTLVHWQGTPATTSARAYPGACLSELTITGNVESSLMSYTAKGLAYPSLVVPTTPPVFAPSVVAPQATWRYLLGIGGPASGGTKVVTLREFSLTISRALRAEYTMQNLQSPYIIQRGAVSVTGSFTFVAVADETVYAPLLSNTQPQIQIIGDVGAGATDFGLTLDMLLGAYDTAKINTSEEAIGYDVTFVAVANTTNVGASGGYSPIKVTVRNQTAAGTY